MAGITFSGGVMDTTYDLLNQSITTAGASGSIWATGTATSYPLSAAPPYWVADYQPELPGESPGEKCARYISEISAAIGGGSERASNEKKSSGKKSKALAPNESFNKWAAARGLTTPQPYQQLAAQNVASQRSAFPTRSGHITGTL